MANARQLASHIIAVYCKEDGQKEFRCNFASDICVKTYRKRDRLIDHLCTHTEERPFVCRFEGCDGAFSSRDNLRKHEKRHNKPERCEHCGGDFADRYSLKRHIHRFHAQAEEDICVVESYDGNLSGPSCRQEPTPGSEHERADQRQPLLEDRAEAFSTPGLDGELQPADMETRQHIQPIGHDLGNIQPSNALIGIAGTSCDHAVMEAAIKCGLNTQPLSDDKFPLPKRRFSNMDGDCTSSMPPPKRHEEFTQQSDGPIQKLSERTHYDGIELLPIAVPRNSITKASRYSVTSWSSFHAWRSRMRASETHPFARKSSTSIVSHLPTPSDISRLSERVMSQNLNVSNAPSHDFAAFIPESPTLEIYEQGDHSLGARDCSEFDPDEIGVSSRIAQFVEGDRWTLHQVTEYLRAASPEGLRATPVALVRYVVDQDLWNTISELGPDSSFHWCRNAFERAIVTGKISLVSHLAEKSIFGLKWRYYCGDSPLHFAAVHGSKDLLRTVLVYTTCIIDLAGFNGDTALHRATAAQNSSNANQLIAFGANVDAANSADELPTSVAFNNRLLPLFANMVSRSRVLNRHDRHGMALIHYVARRWKAEFMHVLLENHVDLTNKDLRGRTALHHACEVASPCFGLTGKIIETLIFGGIPVNEVDDNGETALHAFCRRQTWTYFIMDERKACLGALFEAGIMIDARSKNGETALQVLAETRYYEPFGSLQEAEMLVAKAADTTATCQSGQTIASLLANTYEARKSQLDRTKFPCLEKLAEAERRGGNSKE